MNRKIESRDSVSQPNEGVGISSLVRVLGGSAGIRLVGIFFGFIVGLLLARGLGPASYGVYGTAMAIAVIAMIPVEFGLPQLVTREVAGKFRDDLTGVGAVVSNAARRIFISSIATGLVALVVLNSGMVQVSPALRNCFLVAVIWIPVVALGNVFGAGLRGLHLVLLGQIGDVLLRPIIVSCLVLLVLAISGGFTPAEAMGLNVVAATGASIFAFIALRLRLGRRIGILSKRTIRVPQFKLKDTIPLAMSEGLRVMTSQIGVVILAAMASDADVGQYRVAYQVYTVATLPSTLVNVACAPIIASFYAKDRIDEITQLNMRVFYFLLTSASVIAVIYGLVGQNLVRIVFGAAYNEAGRLLLFFFVGEIFVACFGHPVVVLNMTRYPHIVMKWSLVSLLVTGVMGVALSSRFGAIGAVIGTSVGLIVWNAGSAVNAKLVAGIDSSPVTRIIRRRARGVE